MKSSQPEGDDRVPTACSSRAARGRRGGIGLELSLGLHLGVTEAGDGEDGRIKSAIGIGSLLNDGIGDTIRVSLTEDSVHEIPVAKALVAMQVAATDQRSRVSQTLRTKRSPLCPSTRFTYRRRETLRIKVPSAVKDTATTVAIGDEEVPRVAIRQAKFDLRSPTRSARSATFSPTSFSTFPASVEVDPRDMRAIAVPERRRRAAPRYRAGRHRHSRRRRIPPPRRAPHREAPDPAEGHARALARRAAPVPRHACSKAPRTSARCSATASATPSSCKARKRPGQSLRLAFNILQAAGARIFKTDYVACPSCGRTLFDLQSTTAKIKASTLHLKGVKIAIMGCIVNGPGEMADADFGYVGGAPGKVNLYVGKTPVKFNIPEAEAVDRLKDLIREHGKWVEPAAVATV